VTAHIVDAAAGERQARVVELMLRAQDELVAGFEALEDAAAGDANGADLGAGRFGNHTWTRPTGGDGGPGGGAGRAAAAGRA
jgi:coproporphyrinogen III oxidase